MIAVCRAGDRRLVRLPQLEVWETFQPPSAASATGGAPGILLGLVEARLQPGAALPSRGERAAEILTYVAEGSLAYIDPEEGAGILRAGEFERLTAAHGLRHEEANASRTGWARLYQIRLRPFENGHQSIRQRRRFSAADRSKSPCVVASGDGRNGSLRVHQDAQVLSVILPAGHVLLHELHAGRSLWLHLVRGAARIGDLHLSAGDGAGFSEERVVSLLPREETEVLLIDVAGALPGLRPDRAAP